MPPEAEGPARAQPVTGLFASARDLLATALALAHTRLELVTTEIEEELHRVAEILLWMFVVVFFHLLWKFGGFLFNVILAAVYGGGTETDAYLYGFSKVVFPLYLIVEESMGPAFLPVFILLLAGAGGTLWQRKFGGTEKLPELSDEIKPEDERSAWEFASTALNLLFVILVIVVAIGQRFPEQITRLAGDGAAMRR